MKRKNIILLISISAILAIIIMLISSIGNDSISNNIISNNQLSQPEIINSYGVSRSLEGDHVLSSGSPKNTIIEYASMTCPHCSDFHNETFPKIKWAMEKTIKVEIAREL